MNARSKGAQPGNGNARKHGGYAAQPKTRGSTARLNAGDPRIVSDPSHSLTIITLIKDLEARQMEILEYARKAAESDQPGEAIRAMAVYGQNAARLARMLEKSGAGTGQSLTDALHAALDEAQAQIDQHLKTAAGAPT